MKLYHASTVVIEKPDALHSRDKLDFGKGFYLTAIRAQTLRYAERFTIRGIMYRYVEEGNNLQRSMMLYLEALLTIRFLTLLIFTLQA